MIFFQKMLTPPPPILYHVILKWSLIIIEKYQSIWIFFIIEILKTFFGNVFQKTFSKKTFFWKKRFSKFFFCSRLAVFLKNVFQKRCRRTLTKNFMQKRLQKRRYDVLPHNFFTKKISVGKIDLYYRKFYLTFFIQNFLYEKWNNPNFFP